MWKEKTFPKWTFLFDRLGPTPAALLPHVSNRPRSSTVPCLRRITWYARFRHWLDYAHVRVVPSNQCQKGTGILPAIFGCHPLRATSPHPFFMKCECTHNLPPKKIFMFYTAKLNTTRIQSHHIHPCRSVSSVVKNPLPTFTFHEM